MLRLAGPCRHRCGSAAVCSVTAIEVPAAAAEKSAKSRSFAPQKRTESSERIMQVQSSIILPWSSVSAP
jgi:hypothetical protein